MIPEVVDEGRPDPDRRPLAGPSLIRPGAAPEPIEPPVVWVDGGAGLAITTWGSSSSPRVPTSVEVEGDLLTIDVAVRDDGAGVMTADLAAYVTVIRTPAGLDPRTTTVVRIHGRDSELPPLGHG